MATTLEQLYVLQIPQVRELFIEVMEKVVDRAVIEEMEKAIENNDVEALYKASGFTPAILNPLIDKLEDIYKQTAELTVGGWPRRVRTPFGLRVPIFDIRNEKVEQDLKKFSSNFVTRIDKEVKENLRTVLSEGMARGDNPRTTALNIVGRVNALSKKREGGIIGLSTNQVGWISNVRKYLETLDEKYLSMGLRDKRFDSLVKKAISEKRKLTKDEVTKLTTAYERKALKYRADAIARTETIQSINRGEYMAIQQNIDEGLIQERQVRKWWDDTRDGRTRTTHVAMGMKYDKKHSIPLNEPFVSPSGSKLMYPGDQSLGANPKEVIHCRCKAQYNIDFLAEYV